MFHKLDSEMPALLENMFSDGLVPRLIEALREIMDLCNERGSRTRPIRRAVQRLLMDEISMVLAGKILRTSRTVRGVRARSARTFIISLTSITVSLTHIATHPIITNIVCITL